MHQRRLKAMLEEAERRMFEGAWRIMRQKELIEEMSNRAADVSRYRELLARFEESQRLQVEQVQRLRRDLYDPSRFKGQLRFADVITAPPREPSSANSLTVEEGGEESRCHPPAERRAEGEETNADRSDGSFHHPHDKRGKDGRVL